VLDTSKGFEDELQPSGRVTIMRAFSSAAFIGD
jgi:hypothetical protein